MKLGDIYTRCELIKENAAFLFSSYENDDDLAGMADCAQSLGSLCFELSQGLSETDTALKTLSGAKPSA